MKNLFLYLANSFTKTNEVKIAATNNVETKAKQQANVARSRGKSVHAFGGSMGTDSQAIFSPKHTKLKGWMKSEGQSVRERKN